MKAIVFIDYANIKAWAREKGLSFDMEKLLHALKNSGADKARLYYGTDPKNPHPNSFLQKMSEIGFDVTTKEVKYFKISLLNLLKQRTNNEMLNQLSIKTKNSLLAEVLELEKKHFRLLSPKANFDVEITKDLLLEKSDKIILFSGDSDFVAVVKYLRQHKKKILIVSGRKYLSGELYKEADRILTLERLLEEIDVTLAKARPALRRVLKKSNYFIPSINNFVKTKW